ncbi:MAG: uptake transporter, substrate-binding protein [Nitrososphaeraceae archaeon]|nr:uptake transporter, substrate-binding protein [Nitrososphaeraceae archaeon]
MIKFLIMIASIFIISYLSYGYAHNENDIVQTHSTEKIKVVTSFYPIYQIAKEIGGDNIIVTSVIPFGSQPHDWEITPQKVSEIKEADMIIYNGIGFDAWLGDDDQFHKSFLVDVSKGLQLIKKDKELEKVRHDNHKEHESRYDPHIWLDPILVKNISKTISNALVKLDPHNTNSYLQNTEHFIQQLDNLDFLIKTTLDNCELSDFITFHESFSYFANRYGLTQHSIQSLPSEGEILPQQITKIISLAKSLGIDTIYSEELKDQRLSQILASEIPNGKVLLLSPIEGSNNQEEQQNQNGGYIDKMHMNLENLKQGLKCE